MMSASPNTSGISPGEAGCALALVRNLIDMPDGQSHNSASCGQISADDCSASEGESSFLSNSSSLESLCGQNTIDNFESSISRPLQSATDCQPAADCSSFGSTTSCSEESFVLGECHDNNAVLDTKNTTNKTVEAAKDLSQCLSKISLDFQNLNSTMPVVDFEKLESRLLKATEQNHDVTQRRRLVSEEVRRRLAMEPLDEIEWRSRGAQARPFLGCKLQCGKNLQVCFVNDDALLPEQSDTDDSGLQKSQSTPNFGAILEKCPFENTHDTMSATQLKRLSEDSAGADFFSRQKCLEREALLLLTKAQEAASMQMEVERQAKIKSACKLSTLISVPLGSQKKFSRSQLTKMSTTCLQIILNDFHMKIRDLNDELMQLLIEKDTLHMEQDSKLVDIADLLQYANSAPKGKPRRRW